MRWPCKRPPPRHRFKPPAVGSTRRYYYSHLEEAAASGRPGAPHGIEVPAVFGTADLRNCLAAQPTPNDRALFARVEERWASFAREGQPRAAGAADWPQDGCLRPVVLEFGPTEQVQPSFMRDRLNALIGGLNFVGRKAANR